MEGNGKMERDMKSALICVLYILLSVLYLGCGRGATPGLELPTASKGYVLYVSARKTEVMIDFTKSDGLSRGTKLDVFRMEAPGMKEPVKIGEITVEKVGRKMSEAKVTAITSSLRMEQGDRVFPHPYIIISDDSWIASMKPVDGWRSDFSLSGGREWASCEIPSQRRNTTPELRQLVADTDVKPIWYPSVTSHHGDVFFRKTFHIDAKPATAEMYILCGGRTNIYINDRWVGEAKEWPDIDTFRVRAFLKRGKNLIAVHSIREPRIQAPPVLFLALTIKTEFQ